MTLELKRYKDDFFDNSTEPYRLSGVKDVINKAGCFEISIFDRRLFFVKDFEYVRCVETGEYYISNGKWVDTK